MLQCNTPEELAKMIDELHGQAEILFKGKLVTLIVSDNALDGEMEDSYRQAQADIAADPSLRQRIEKSREDFDKGRFYTTDEVLEMLKHGENRK